ncbi:hypothetical protein AXF42_Ash002051 [Apostasia shenzhenica]|uniref:Uncharacterized protein n=1 Tax=Apostasia shenzhenica TaxID=1088818 RepID=A0A2I0AME1_9ASPA|nr:hypothetical protein AXF42_Ash002051 [Apostasia shenzhenica]
MGDNVDMEIEEDEEEDDLDFNPLLRGETSSEASSSLSSENESPCNNVNKNIGSSLNRKIDFPSSGAMDKIRSCNRGSVSEDEEIVMLKSEVLTSSIQEVQILTNLEGICKGILSNCENDGADMMAEKNPLVEVCDQENNQKPVLDKDDIDCDDAICRRTRAQLSLANYTLEELEAFLQESDDDCDLQNVDEEEVYHKFLAAVLQEGDDKGQAEQGDGTFDEDEDNDADFEVELEELLESDVDETIGCSTEQNKKKDEEAHIPETRQKKRLKESMTRKKFHLGQAKARYRPLLPYVPNSQRSFLPPLSRPLSSAGLSHCSTSFSSADLICGLTNCQIGQLYCLIHEHVQLLLQVFSICVLDPSRHQVASDVRKLISEMVERREMALAWRKDPYPLLCFHPPNLHCSLQNDSNRMISCSWRPVVENPVFSILDVAPLQLAKIYLVDVKETESRHRKICLEDGHVKSHLKKEPLFALPMSSSVSNSSTEFVGRIITMPPALSPSSSCQLQSDHNQQPKKSLAATLVESTMRQSVALVPSDIAKLAQRFFHLFNAALFPHKPPTPAVANRVLFTDAEDGLLAMGLMEHNNDWLAIQQHFLPCKTTHQIFVRQKNRSSSKAPDNPIKAVKHMKASPLTEDEKALICDVLSLPFALRKLSKYFNFN